VYHVELRQFPHNFCRFNLTEPELYDMILRKWARGDWIELGERKWSPHQASLKVIEGPELPLARLAMGRGWRNAVRQGKDVTADLLARARAGAHDKATDEAPESMASGSAAIFTSVRSDAAGRKPTDDSLALELLALLGEDPGPLLRAWRLALESHPNRTPSECLALAEDLVRP
jgi:hypothetical protein